VSAADALALQPVLRGLLEPWDDEYEYDDDATVAAAEPHTEESVELAAIA
jgi:hypothetical protein